MMNNKNESFVNTLRIFQIFYLIIINESCFLKGVRNLFINNP